MCGWIFSKSHFLLSCSRCVSIKTFRLHVQALLVVGVATGRRSFGSPKSLRYLDRGGSALFHVWPPAPPGCPHAARDGGQAPSRAGPRCLPDAEAIGLSPGGAAPGQQLHRTEDGVTLAEPLAGCASVFLCLYGQVGERSFAAPLTSEVTRAYDFLQSRRTHSIQQ